MRQSFTSGNHNPPANGFTLIELVVALFVFALLAMAGTAMLSVSIRSQNVVKTALSRSAETGRIVTLLSTDLAQATTRPVRNKDGASQSAFFGQDGGADGLVLAYVRADANGARRIEWWRKGAALIRATRQSLDGESRGQESVLATSLTALQLRYRYKGEWQSDWQPTRADALPHAVEVQIGQQGGAPVKALFLVGVGLP